MGIRIFAFIAATLASVPGASAEDCDCDRYASHVTLVSLARQAATIGLRSIDTSGAAFFRSPEARRMHARLLASAREAIPERCQSELLSDFEDRFTIVARFSSETGSGERLSGAGTRSESQLGAYTSLLQGLTDTSGCTAPTALGDNPDAGQQAAFDAANSTYESCVRSAREAGYGRLTGAMRGNRSLQRASSGVTGDPMGGMSATDLTVLRTFHAIVNAGGDVAARDRILASAEVQRLPFMDKVAISALWLRRGNQHYSNDRADGVAPHNQGPVSWTMINGNLREQTRLGLFNADGLLSEEFLRSAVCRDLHIGAVEMTRRMGVPRSYGKAYDLASGGGHMTMHTQDPGSPLTNVDVNYGDVSPRAGGDQRALYTNDWAGDATFDYRMYHPRGSAGRLTSELGRYVMEAAGMDIRSSISGEPLAEARSTVVGGRFGIVSEPNFTLDAQFAHGRDGIGSRHTGGGFTLGWAQQTLFPGRLGTYAGVMQRDPGYGPIQDQRLTLDILYASLEQEARTPDFRVVDGVTVRGEAGAGVELSNTHARAGVGEEDEGEWGTNFDFRFYTGMRVDQGDPLRDRFSAIYRAGVQSFIGKDDPRDRNHIGNQALAFNHFVGSAQFNFRPEDGSDTRFILDTTLMLNQFGSYGRAELGLATDRFVATASVQGRLEDDSGTFVDGARREVGLNLRTMPTDWLDLTLSATAPLEETPAEVSDTPGGSSTGPQIMGGAALRF